MFGKIMNRYYYGKSGKGDYSPEDLPTTRMQLFWEMLRVRFSGLIRLNLIYAVAWLPAIIVIGMGLLNALTLLTNVAEAMTPEELAEAGAVITMAELPNALLSTLFSTLLLLIPCLTITGPATAGIAYVTRNWARDEHAFIWSDFKDAVKANWKQGLLAGFITGLFPTILYVGISFYGQMAASFPLCYAALALLGLVAILWFCSLLYLYPQMVTYELTFRQLVKNSVYMAVGRLPVTVGIKLLSLLPWVIAFIVAMYTPYAFYAVLVLGLYYILLGFSLSRFIGASVSNAAFDKYLNPNIEGAKVNQGLYVEEDDEDESEAGDNHPEA